MWALNNSGATPCPIEKTLVVEMGHDPEVEVMIPFTQILEKRR
jgi:hypothetical protein